jgi:hypothetical protein
MSTLDLSRVNWRKSTRSSGNGACIEVGVWRKATYSTTNGGGCIEVAPTLAAVAVRDSKDPDGARLAFTAEDWDRFTGQIKDGGFHLA